MKAQQEQERKRRGSADDVLHQRRRRKVFDTPKHAAPWPPTIDAERLKNSLRAFREAVSFPSVQHFCCAVCARSRTDTRRVPFRSNDDTDKALLLSMLSLLQIPDALYSFSEEETKLADEIAERESKLFARRAAAASSPDELLHLYNTQQPRSVRSLMQASTIRGMLLDLAGLWSDPELPTIKFTHFYICASCESSCLSNKLPRLSLANHNWIGPVPPELQGLSLLEELLLSPFRCRSIVFKVRQWLAGKGTAKYAVSSGNLITFEQDVALLYHSLPWLLPDVLDCITIVVISADSVDKTDATLVKAFQIRRSVVRNALHWLKLWNVPWSLRVSIDETALDKLPVEGVPDAVWTRLLQDTDVATEAKERAGHIRVDDHRTQPHPLNWQALFCAAVLWMWNQAVHLPWIERALLS